VGDLIGHAVNAVLNRGAKAFRDGAEMVYPSGKAFEQETTWHIWKAAGKT